jgi:tetratricopeptide (TPR) repeat protein
MSREAYFAEPSGFFTRLWIWLTGGTVRRQYREAVRLLASPEISSANERILLRIGEICLAAGDAMRAIAAFWSAGRMLVAQGRTQHAIFPLKRVVQLAPGEVLAYIELASCYESLARRRDAAYQYQAAAALLEPTVPGEAAALLQRAVALDPAQKSARLRFTEIQRALGLPIEASDRPDTRARPPLLRRAPPTPTTTWPSPRSISEVRSPAVLCGIATPT